MQSWTGGYVADLEYTSDFHPQMSPHHMRAVALLNGWAPAQLPENLTYCELGCGVGHTLTVLAAANPQNRFVGVDLMPGHILAARELAARAGLDNIIFLEASFGELADREDALPPCDVIALHGVWSWVSAANRRTIVQLIDRYLKTGGLAYVSYNAMPGLVLGLPIQRLLLELSRMHSGRSDARFTKALAFVDRLAEAGADLVRDNPIYEQIKRIAGQGRHAYLVHEHLNETWTPMFFADIAAELAEAKLGFVGSIDPARSFTALTTRPEQAALLEEIEDPILRETIIDYCFSNTFRRDLFARGARRLSAGEHNRLLRDVRLGLTVPVERIGFTVNVTIGEASMNEPAYRPMFEALAEGPRTIGALLDLPAVRNNEKLQPGEVLGMMVASGQVAVAAPGERPADPAAVRALNQAVCHASVEPGLALSEALASPVLGGGLSTDLLERLIWRALDIGVPTEPMALAEHLIPLILARGDQVVKDDKPIEDEDERRARMAESTSEFLAERLPLWRQLAIL